MISINNKTLPPDAGLTPLRRLKDSLTTKPSPPVEKPIETTKPKDQDDEKKAEEGNG